MIRNLTESVIRRVEKVICLLYTFIMCYIFNSKRKITLHSIVFFLLRIFFLPQVFFCHLENSVTMQKLKQRYWVCCISWHQTHTTSLTITNILSGHNIRCHLSSFITMFWPTLISTTELWFFSKLGPPSTLSCTKLHLTFTYRMNYPNLINLRVQSEGNILFLDSQNCEKLHKNLKGKKLKDILPRGTEEKE